MGCKVVPSGGSEIEIDEIGERICSLGLGLGLGLYESCHQVLGERGGLGNKGELGIRV